jgi:cytochrome c-type biogenesis protein CcmH/NrfG
MNDDVNLRILSELRLLRQSSNFALVVCAVLVVGVAIYLPLRYGSLSSRQPAQTQTDSWEAVRTAIDHIDYDKASAIAERILKRYPNDYYGYSYLGSIALAADRIEEAERHFARAYELLPSEENEKMLRAVRKRIESERPVAR